MTTPLRRPAGPRAHVLARRSRRAHAGTSFIELMLAIVIVSTTLLASTASMQGSAQVYHYFADGKHEALMLAQEIHEAAKLMPWSHAVGAEPVFGDEVYDVWDLDGKTFNPPRSADYDVVISHIGWSQSCEVLVVDMAHPDVEVDPATFQGPTLTELKVTIKQGSEVVDTPSWWLSKPAGS